MKCLLATTALVLAFAGAANASTLKFFSGTTAYGTSGGLFSGAGTVYNSIQNNPTACVGGGPGNCDNHIDTIQTQEVFGSGTGGLTASANSGQQVWSDTQPGFGGLGVTAGEDNIDGTDVLTLTFNVPVQLTGIATLFDTADHGPFGNLSNMSGLGSETFLLNGVAQRFDLANLGLLNLSTGTVFTFAENTGGNNTSFYISGVSFISGQSTGQTPLPGTIGFFAAGLTGLIGLGRRKFRQPAA